MDSVMDRLSELELALKIDDLLWHEQNSLDLVTVAYIVSDKLMNPKALLHAQRQSWKKSKGLNIRP